MVQAGEMQNQGDRNQNSTPDQVVLLMDQLQQPVKARPKFELPNDSTTTAATTVLSEEDKAANMNTSRTRTLRRLKFSKPKSRFYEANNQYENYKPIDTIDGTDESEDDEDDEDEFSDEDDGGEEGSGKVKKYRKKKRKIRCITVLEWICFFTIMAGLICSLTVKNLKQKTAWGLESWQLCLMMMVIISGRLVSGWLVGFLVFFIERNFMLREKVLYFVYGLRKSFQNCVWLALVLISWSIMFSPSELQRHHKILKKVFRALIAILIAATIWLVKILLVKMLASSFHVATFFDRMKESVFHHYILEMLSGPPIDESEIEPRRPRNLRQSKSLPARLRYGSNMSATKRMGSRKIDMEKLRKLSMESRASAWSVRRLINYIRSSGLSTISRTVDDFGQAESEITSEWEARTCAQRTFKNVAKPGAKYIEEEDLLRFLRSEEVHTIFPMFEGAVETGQISKSAFRNWVVRAYTERKFLAHSLNDTKTAVQQLHKLASAVVVVIIIVVCLLVMGVATTKVIFLFTSQLLVVGFMFQNTCKTIFESIIFVFVMHPFDVGDRCVIDGVQMIVEEMNILTTVFLRYDNEKIFYPNSVLSTKPISNFYRSPDMADTIDFTIDVSTSIENVNSLKKLIQAYIESKPKHWNPKHSLIVKEIENVDKMKMTLCVLHTMNHQNFGEKNSRRTELVLELKKIFETIGIKYHVLPQEIHITHLPVGMQALS